MTSKTSQPKAEVQQSHHNSRIRMGDARYDITFKDLFSAIGSISEGITPQNRLISFLNSIYFPNVPAQGLKIRKLEYLPTIFNITCKCECSTSTLEVKDVLLIEIQMVSQNSSLNRNIAQSLNMLEDSIKSATSYNNIPKVKILFIMNNKDTCLGSDVITTTFIAKEEQGKPKQQLTSVIEWKYVQLPLVQEQKLLEGYESITQDWLNMLSFGFRYTPIDGIVSIPRNQLAVEQSNEIISAQKILKLYANDSILSDILKKTSSAEHDQEAIRNDDINTAVGIAITNIRLRNNKITAKKSVRNCFDIFVLITQLNKDTCSFQPSLLSKGVNYWYIEQALKKYQHPTLEPHLLEQFKLLFMKAAKDHQCQDSILSAYSLLSNQTDE